MHRVISEWETVFGPGPALSRLLRYVSGPTIQLPNRNVECDLCETWSMINALTYEFILHPDARWHDAEGFKGRPVTAQDVVFSLERLRTVDWPHASLLDSVREITALDDHTIQLVLRYPDPDLAQALANPHAVIIAPEAVPTADAHGAAIVGSGPWRWTGWSSGQIDLIAFQRYHRVGRPRVSKLEIFPVDTLAQASALLEVQQVDIAQIPEEEWNDMRALGFESRLVPRQGQGLMIALNASGNPFDDQEVRQALLFSIDPQAALKAVWGGLGRVGLGVPVIQSDWLLGEEQIRSYFAQPSRAVQLLSDKKTALKPITLTVANFGDRYVEYGQVIKNQISKAGFEVTLEILSRSQYLTRVWYGKDFEIFVGPVPPASSTNSFLLPLLHSRGQWHITGHEDMELDRLIEEQSTEMDMDRRKELLLEIQARVLTQGLMFMPVITVERWAFDSRITDFHPNLTMGDGSFWELVGIREDVE